MRDSNPSPRAFIPLALAILAIASAGCGRAPAPIAPAGERTPALSTAVRSDGVDVPIASSAAENGFYPLHLGNEWSYAYTLSIVIIPEGGPPDPAFGLSDRRTRDLVCVETRGGNPYVVERTYYPSPRVFTWVRYRQDRDGLFEADVETTLPPTCSAASGRRHFDAGARVVGSGEEAWAAIAAKFPAPARQAAYREAWEGIAARAAAIRRALGAEPEPPRAAGVEAGEITRLEYPLRPGAHWVIRETPRFEATVEGAETLDLAVGHVPAWRIRIDFDGLGANDRVSVWYGRAGFLMSDVHVEGVATDPEGNPIGRLIYDETEELEELALNGGRFATP